VNINIDIIEDALDKANKILSEVYPKYNKPTLCKIKIGKSRTNWASIKRLGSTFELTVSDVFNLIPECKEPISKLEGTMIHELIHTIPNCMNHGNKFKAVAALVNCRYREYNITRCTPFRDYGIESIDIVRKSSKLYKVTCDHCHRVWDYHRRPKWINHANLAECPYCLRKGFTIKEV
jgi:hypothetical protein